MFYNSNLRQYLVLPNYDSEINHNADIFAENIETIYTVVPQAYVRAYHGTLDNPELFSKVCGI